MERFQKQEKKLPLSYYKISGIHGLPVEKWPDQAWNNMEQVTPKKKGQKGYFCTHSSILFLPWHRPYLALFEAELHKHVTATAEDYDVDEDRDIYINAAKNFRMPYWDWASPADKDIGLFPQEVLGTTVHQVVRPGGKKQKVPLDRNPLASYKFGGVGKRDGLDMFTKSGGRLRYPINDGMNSDEKVLRNEFQILFEDKDSQVQKRPYPYYAYRKGKNLNERVLFILQSYHAFRPISNNQYSGIPNSWENWGSLEDIHNVIHNYLGGGGHMSNPATSAFDPIFWLHHTNIDRLFAIWQAMYDDPEDASTYVQHEISNEGTYTTEVRTKEVMHMDLTPFFTPTDDKVPKFWTSERVRTTKTFGYVYPETQDWVLPTPTDVLNEIRRIYKNGSFANIMMSSRATFDQSVNDLKSLAVSHRQVAETALDTTTIIQAARKDGSAIVPPDDIAAEVAKIKLPTDRSLADLVENNKYLEWLVDIKVRKHALGGDFMVHVFLGPPEDENPSLYVANPTHVGSFSTFGQDTDTSCEKCREGQAEHMQVTGQIPLTMALVERYLAGQAGGLAPVPAIEFLQKELHWRVTRLDGQRIGRGSVNGLLVGVVTNEVTLPAAGEEGRPQYAPNVVPRPEITTNEAGNAPRGRGTGYTGGPIPAAA